MKHRKGIGDNIGVVKVENTNQINKLENLYSWHFIWSKYYFYKKHYGRMISLIIFLPIIIRILFRIFLYKVTQNDLKKEKYKNRLGGFISSLLGNKSSKRL